MPRRPSRWRLVALLAAGLTCAAASDVAAQTVTLSVPPGTTLAEDSSFQSFDVTATLSSVRTSATTVDLSLGGTVRATDYAVVSLPAITIAANSISGTAAVEVRPVDDNFYEGNETLVVNGDATGLTVIGATVILVDEETQPTLELERTRGPIALIEGQTKTFELTARLSGGAAAEDDFVFTLELNEAQHSAAVADDFTTVPALPASFTIPAGNSTSVFYITVTAVIDSSQSEQNETVYVDAKGSLAGTAIQVDPPGPLRLVDIRLPPPVGFNVSLEWIGPAGVRGVRGGYPQEVTLRATALRFSGGVPHEIVFTLTPKESVDWLPASTQVTIPEGASVGEVTLTVTPPTVTHRMTIAFDVSGSPADGLLPLSSAFVIWPTGLPSLTGFVGYSSSPQGYVPLGRRVAFAASFNRPFGLESGTLRVTLDSGVKVTGPCSLVQNTTIDCGFLVVDGDYDFDGFVDVARGALQFIWRDDANTADVWPTPVVPAAPVSLPIGAPVYGAVFGVDLSVTPESLQEGAGPTMVTVRAVKRGNPLVSGTLSVPLVFGGGTASAADYEVSGPLTITIPSSQLEGSTTLTVTPVEDFVKENRIEVVHIGTDRRNTSVVLAQGVDLGIIDAPTIDLSAIPGNIAEEGGPQTVTVTASLGDPDDSVRPRPIPVTLTWGGGTAGAGDFSASGTTVTIPANARSGTATVTITPVDDRLLEGDETIGLRGTTPGLPVQGTTLTLKDDEEVPAVSLAVSRDRILESDRAVTVTVSATLDPDVAMADDVTTVELVLMGSATRGTDYTRTWSLSPPVISIPPNATMGSNTVTLTLTPQQDDVAEGDETIVVEGTATTESRSLVVKVANITLEDDDVRGVVVTPTRLEIDEGTSEIYAVRLTAEPLSDVTVSVNVPAGAPLEARPPVLTFTPTTWSTAQTVTVTVEDDADAVMHADVDLTHTVGGGGYDGVTALSVTVTLDDTTVPQMEIAAASEEESAGQMTFAVTLDVASSEEVSAAWATAGETAAAGADYTESSGTVVFPAGVTSRTIVVPVLSDDLDEEDETFKVTLSGVQNAALSVSEATGTITDDDDAPALSVSAPGAAAVEGMHTSLVFTVTLAPASGREVTVGYATSDGTAMAPGDYTAARATLTFAPGETSKSVTVPIVDDDLDEPEETFTMVLGQPQGATLSLSMSEATGTIVDNDDAPELSVENATAAEDAGPVTFTVTLTPASGRVVTVGYATSDGTATSPADYTTAAGSTLTFAPGETTKTIEVAVFDDAVDEADEEFTLTLNSPTNAGFAGGVSTVEATGTITDDDATPVVGVEDVTVAENARTLSFLVTLTPASGQEVVVSYATSDGTATSPADYAAMSGTVTFDSGQRNKMILVSIVDDAVDENEAEDFTLTLSSPSNAVFAGDAETLAATGTITDDDDPAVEVSFGEADYEAVEGGSAVTVSVSIDVDPEREVTGNWLVTIAERRPKRSSRISRRSRARAASMGARPQSSRTSTSMRARSR